MEERDIQIRSFRVRLPLDVMMAFSANPEDYTSRGNIITPLKDRIDSQIITHYPRTPEDAMAITDQEARLDRPGNGPRPVIPPLVRRIAERIAFEARDAKDYVDQKSGVSARLSSAALELLHGAVELRGVLTGEAAPRARLTDLESVIPAITGKLELVYAGEQEGPARIARAMVGKAVKAEFQARFLDPYNRKEKAPEDNPYHGVLAWFEKGNTLTLGDRLGDAAYRQALESVPELRRTLSRAALDRSALEADKENEALHMELLLEGLHLHSRLSKENVTEGFTYRDMMSDILGQ
jgi:magnesium chelatase subunit I